MSTTLGIQREMRMLHTVMWPVQLCCIFPHYFINGTIKKIAGYKMFFFLSLYKVSLKHF